MQQPEPVHEAVVGSAERHMPLGYSASELDDLLDPITLAVGRLDLAMDLAMYSEVQR